MFAVDAAALLDDDGEALALLRRRGDVLGDVAEGDGEPLLLVQAVVAEGRRTGGQRRQTESDNQKQAVQHGSLLIRCSVLILCSGSRGTSPSACSRFPPSCRS